MEDAKNSIFSNKKNENVGSINQTNQTNQDFVGAMKMILNMSDHIFSKQDFDIQSIDDESKKRYAAVYKKFNNKFVTQKEIWANTYLVSMLIVPVLLSFFSIYGAKNLFIKKEITAIIFGVFFALALAASIISPIMLFINNKQEKKCFDDLLKAEDGDTYIAIVDRLTYSILSQDGQSKKLQNLKMDKKKPKSEDEQKETPKSEATEIFRFADNRNKVDGTKFDSSTLIPIMISVAIFECLLLNFIYICCIDKTGASKQGLLIGLGVATILAFIATLAIFIVIFKYSKKSIIDIVLDSKLAIKKDEKPVAGAASTETPVAGAASIESPVAGAASTESPVAGAASIESPVAGAASTESPVAVSTLKEEKTIGELLLEGCYLNPIQTISHKSVIILYK